ncbi:MAG: histidine phosphatase family protein, partial [Planctomycetota bacterium]
FQGDWNQKERKTVYTPEILSLMGTKNSLFIPPNGESLRMVERRISNWLEDEILYNKTFIEQHPKAGIALFTHGMAIRCLLRYIFQSDPSLTWKIKIFNGSISWLVFKSDGWHPYSLNEVSHLKEIGFFPS